MASRQWVRWNEDSRAAANRAKHLAENGGSFVHGKGGWMWIAPQPVEKKVKPDPRPREVKSHPIETPTEEKTKD